VIESLIYEVTTEFSQKLQNETKSAGKDKSITLRVDKRFFLDPQEE